MGKEEVNISNEDDKIKISSFNEKVVSTKIN